MDGAAAFDGADCEARCVREAADDSSLPFERTRDGLVYLARIVQVNNVYMALGCRNNEQGVLDVHAVHTLLALQLADGVFAGQVPVLDSLVPRARGQKVLATVLEPADALDTGAMRLPVVRGFDLAAVARISEIQVENGALIASCRNTCTVL